MDPAVVRYNAPMPIPFRDADALADLGLVGYLTIAPAPAGSGYLGALLLINARGEPVEFTYNRIEAANTFLWRPADLVRHAQHRLAASLLAACPRTPRILLCRDDEVSRDVFTRDLTVAVPIALLARGISAVDYDSGEVTRTAEEEAHLFWIPRPPGPESPEQGLIDALIARGLLWEPFDRAQGGLREVYRTEFEGVW